MAYKKAELEAQALKAIKDNNLMFVTDVPAYLPCTTKTFYNKELHELQAIKESLEQNRVKTKNGLRAKWYKSDNATVQIALYKLIGTEEEADRLNGSRQKIDHTTKGDAISNKFEIVVVGSMEKLPQSEDEIPDIID